MTILLTILLSTITLASVEDAFEKTYPRDNAFCQMGAEKIEIMVRGNQSHIEPGDKLWGEHVFSRIGTGPVEKLPVNAESGLYRLFRGEPSSCAKVVGTTQNGKFAVLFQKNNRPHKNQVHVQYFDLLNFKPLGAVNTTLLGDKARVKGDSFLIRTHLLNSRDTDMGKVTINRKDYLYQHHRFPIWVLHFNEGTSADVTATFEDFEYKSYFKSIDEFKAKSGWLESDKSFTNTTLYVAINHQEKLKCILFLKNKMTFTGEESWICQ